MADPGKANLLNLPPEIREHIYSLILNPTSNRVFQPNDYSDYDYRAAFVLFKLNRQIYYESRRIFRDLNIFVRVETPWIQAREHVGVLGHVPILMDDDRAARFTGHSLSAAIELPEEQVGQAEMHHFVVLLEDLEKFTKLWFYDDLSNLGLNSHLNLRLKLRDPYRADWEEKIVPKWLQRQLIMPFGIVKGLRSVVVTGDPKPLASVENELRAAQAVPRDSPESCLAKSTDLKLQGNKLLAEGKYEEALEVYTKAWEAMHIIIKGRQRHVHADAYFTRELTEEPYKGKNGQAERLSLRLQLVANTCLVYMKLENYEETRFWGMRTILMIRRGFGMDDDDVAPEDEVQFGFPGAVQMGKIYYRTAVAYKELGDKTQARKLLRVARLYLPNDPNVQKELAACAIQIG